MLLAMIVSTEPKFPIFLTNIIFINNFIENLKNLYNK